MKPPSSCAPGAEVRSSQFAALFCHVLEPEPLLIEIQIDVHPTRPVAILQNGELCGALGALQSRVQLLAKEPEDDVGVLRRCAECAEVAECGARIGARGSEIGRMRRE